MVLFETKAGAAAPVLCFDQPGLKLPFHFSYRKSGDTGNRIPFFSALGFLRSDMIQYTYQFFITTQTHFFLDTVAMLLIALFALAI